MNEHHKARMSGLEEELRTLQEENAALQRELEELKALAPAAKDDSGDEAFRRMAAEKLFRIHVEQSEAVWEALERLRLLNEELERDREDDRRRRSEMLEEVERKLKAVLDRLVGDGGKTDDQEGD